MVECPKCGRPMRDSDEKCMYCGTSLSNGVPAGEAPRTPQGRGSRAPMAALIGCVVAVLGVVAVAVTCIVLSAWRAGPPSANPVKAYVDAMRPIWEKGTGIRTRLPQDLDTREGRKKINGIIDGFSALLARARKYNAVPAPCAEIHGIYLEVLTRRIELLRDLAASKPGTLTAGVTFYSQLSATDRRMIIFNDRLKFVISDHSLIVVSGGYIK